MIGRRSAADAAALRGACRSGRRRRRGDDRNARRRHPRRRLTDRRGRQRVHRSGAAVVEGPGDPVVRHQRQAGAADRDHRRARHRRADRRIPRHSMEDRRRHRHRRVRVDRRRRGVASARRLDRRSLAFADRSCGRHPVAELAGASDTCHRTSRRPTRSRVPLGWDRRRFLVSTGTAAAAAVVAGGIAQVLENRRIESIREAIPDSLPTAAALEWHAESRFRPMPRSVPIDAVHHAGRRVLPHRHRALLPAHQPVELQGRHRRHGRQAADVHVRRPVGAAAGRAHRHAVLCVERGRRRPHLRRASFQGVLLGATAEASRRAAPAPNRSTAPASTVGRAGSRSRSPSTAATR